MRDEDELRAEVEERLLHDAAHLKLAHRQKVNVPDQNAEGEEGDGSTYVTCKALADSLAACELDSKAMLQWGLAMSAKLAKVVEEEKANDLERANAKKKKARSRATKTKKARLAQADATADWRTLGKKPVSGARHPQVTATHKGLLAKATAIETPDFENISSKAYNPEVVEFRVYGYVGLANRQSGRQVQVAPPVLEGLLASRRLGSPKHSAAAIVVALQNKEKWDALPDPPRPIDFLDQHRVPMKMAASSKRIEKVELVHMDRAELRLFDSNDTAGPNLVYGYTLWWVLRQFRGLSQLSSSEQRSQYEAIFETYPWPLPEWQHLQLEDGKFPSPIWTHFNDKQKECEELNRVHCVLHLSSKFPRAKGTGFSHLSNGLRKLFVAEHRNTFQSVPFRLVDFEPQWMTIKDEEEEEPEPQRVAQTIVQQDSREMYFRGGTEEDHALLDEDFSLEGANRLKRVYTRHGVPREHKPLPPALDPRDNENEENWRDRWRMFLELVKKCAKLGQISMHDLNQPDEDRQILWAHDMGSELSWTDVQIYIKDGNDRKVVFTIVLVFPTDDSYLQDMESLLPLDPNTDEVMAMVEAEEKRGDTAIATSPREEGAAVIIDKDGGGANDVDTGGVRNEEVVDATALTKEKKPISAPSTRSQSSRRAARDRARPLNFDPMGDGDDDSADATPSKGDRSKRLGSPVPTSDRAGKKLKIDRKRDAQSASPASASRPNKKRATATSGITSTERPAPQAKSGKATPEPKSAERVVDQSDEQVVDKHWESLDD
ncbi:uncharacterized protein MYCGRDRAFT_93554 [Zymoseptoria tritici IPO323]|uniref:Uncharacterized protein n=1 Tax=Zymoseptoria tritici (strain CBS 115943 / IPO323) TaxID=336722 RepID=F9XB47_ZYMTI|nr:uncharacterized protein MYCGRDRAFT_93554 [Zymoseptoria tritici IPO323]EGP87358.1 hypothetical protein MYCGRDRAFT_93554 [Zymoseptoria tritici IPO323]